MSSSINNFNILLGSSLIMESPVLKHVFFLTKDETSYVAYKNYRYKFHSHKDQGTDISMSKKEMKILLDHLPSFQAKLKAIIKEYNDDPDEDSDQDPDQDPNQDPDQDPEDQRKPVKKKRKVEATQKSMPSKNWKVEIINAFKKFETRLILNTYEEAPYIWLRLFFDLDFIEDEEIYKKRKASDKNWKSCKGGIIFNDVSVPALKRFVKKCNLS